MHYYGIRGNVHSWFWDYLSERQQQVHVNRELFSLKTISLRVPPGSVLGPILFIIYINDISNTFSNSKTILFADDIMIYLIRPSPEHCIISGNQELTKLHHWCLRIRLSINIENTHFMLFTSKRQFNFPQLTINTNPIFIVNTVTFLGITYDESMSFKYHIDNVTLKISRHIALLHVLKDYMSQIVLICVYSAHMYPLITYYNLTRCTTYSAYLTPLKLQCKKIVRIITNSNYFTHIDPPPFLNN